MLPWYNSILHLTISTNIYMFFLYIYFSEQQPLKLNSVEVCEVIAAVCSATPSPTANLMTMTSKLSSSSGKPSMDVAVSVLIKLVIDMYVLHNLFACIASFIFSVNYVLLSPYTILYQYSCFRVN